VGSQVSRAQVDAHRLPSSSYSEIISQGNTLDNLHEPFLLDIAKDEDWASLRTEVQSQIPHRGQTGTFNGVVMCELAHAEND